MRSRVLYTGRLPAVSLSVILIIALTQATAVAAEQLLTGKTGTPTEKHTERCTYYQERLDYYTSVMRAGYKPSRYNSLEEKRRYYRKKLREKCSFL